MKITPGYYSSFAEDDLNLFGGKVYSVENPDYCPHPPEPTLIVKAQFTAAPPVPVAEFTVSSDPYNVTCGPLILDAEASEGVRALKYAWHITWV